MLTEIEAVNSILAACGSSPVNSLDGTTTRMARLAQNELTRTSQIVQKETWHWNRHPDFTLSADMATGEVRVPSNTISFQAHHQPWLILRGGRLYDRQKQTYRLERAVSGVLIEELPWDELPGTAQDHIVARAARRLYEQFVGSEANRQNLYQEENRTRAALNNEEMSAAQYNILDDPTIPYLYGSQYITGSPRNDPYA